MLSAQVASEVSLAAASNLRFVRVTYPYGIHELPVIELAFDTPGQAYGAYSVYRRSAASSTWDDWVWSEYYDSTAPTTINLSDQYLYSYGTYEYRAEFYDYNTGETTYSNTVTVAVTQRIAPSVPRTVKAVPGVGRATLSWAAPASVGSTPVTGYTVSWAPAGGAWRSVNVSASTRSRLFTGLPNNVVHYFRVRAHSADGQSPIAQVSARPYTVPTVPRSLRATPGNGRVTLNWLAPASNGGSPITAYRISYAPAGGAWREFNVSPRSRYTITDLRRGTTYYLRIAAVNAAGRSPFTTSVQARTFKVPSTPRSVVTSTPGYANVALRWAAPASNGGSPILGYTISYARAGGTWTSINVSASTRSRTFTGLRGGVAYYFRVAAYNAVGRSVATTSVSAKPVAYQRPGAASIYSVTAANHAVGLGWSQPANTGGLPITKYLVQIGSGGVWRDLAVVSGGTRSYTSTGLVNGSTYYFRVRAANSLGWSSVWSNSVRAVPVAPPPPVTFGGGTYRVGVDIPAGTYRYSGSGGVSDTWCYWERLSGFSGTFADIIANDFIDGPVPPGYVQISSGDVGFFARPGCGTWTKIG
jgi:fibronectin type III domain protein